MSGSNEVHDAIERFAHDGNEASMHCIVQLALNDRFQEEDIAFLAHRLAESGEILTLSSHIFGADVASTGGPSSLSTILCPLFLRCLGRCVPKLAVSGRPAGGIDVMAQIPGYRTEFKKKRFWKYCLGADTHTSSPWENSRLEMGCSLLIAEHNTQLIFLNLQ